MACRGLYGIVLICAAVLLFVCLKYCWAESQPSIASAQGEGKMLYPPGHLPDTADAAKEVGKTLSLWWVIPFVGILLSIALCPLLTPVFWHHHFPKVSAFWALVFALPFIYFYRDVALHQIVHIYLVDYIPFIILLWALFTISGGILVRGNLQGKPIVNTFLLVIGTALASWIGTTGASMVMIRPVLRANATRKKKAHIICFFIFLVSNVGGALTPLGDPPLFLGFLHGVPFFWTMKILPHTLLVSLVLLGLFYMVDTYHYRKEGLKTAVPVNHEKGPMRIAGWHNFLFLGGVVGAIMMSGIIKWEEIMVFDIGIAKQDLMRDIVIIAMGGLSWITTRRPLREANEFSWAPIKEVAYLFAGIFMTILPALAILRAGSEGALAFFLNAVNQPWHYFWLSGGLSSFLDNAPTYLTFFNLALGKLQIPEIMVQHALGYVPSFDVNPVFVSYLKAVSAGSVFMGANSYIGNAPNFMVKSIAEEAGVAMPTFFGYMFKYSIPILIPSFILVSFLFF